MKNILIIFLALSNSSSFGQQGNNILIQGEGTTEIIINNIAPIRNLYYPGDNFENLKPLGPPISKKCTQTFAYETCAFVYGGFELTFTNIHGSPELTEMVIYGPEAQLNFYNYKIQPGSIPKGLFKADHPDIKRGIAVKYNVREQKEKFGNEYSYLELKLNTNNRVDSIFYVRHIL